MSATVSFRFHYEANDFLAQELRDCTFPYNFSGRQTVRDLVEALGVPHSAVGRIEIDRQPVEQTHLVADFDSIDVFPNREIPKEIRFIGDMHTGKLVRFLRMLGFDTYYRNELHDPEIADRSEQEQRIVLTRDIGLLKRNQVQLGYWLRSQDPEVQLAELLKRYRLELHLKPFSRCMECNGKITRVEKSWVQDLVPEHVFSEHSDFYRCSACQKVYWKGSHYVQMQQLVQRIAGIE